MFRTGARDFRRELATENGVSGLVEVGALGGYADSTAIRQALGCSVTDRGAGRGRIQTHIDAKERFRRGSGPWTVNRLHGHSIMMGQKMSDSDLHPASMELRRSILKFFPRKVFGAIHSVEYIRPHFDTP